MRYFSTFSGIGGFELGIQLAYVDSIKRSSERGFKENQEREKGQGLFTEKREDIGTTKGQPRGDYWNIAYKGQPTCVGFSEIDKYATSIYQKHFPYEQCTFCKEKEERTGQEIAEGLRIRKEANDNEGNEGLGSSGAEPQQHNLDSTDRQFNNCECKHKPYGNITKINAEELPDVDLIVGGFPCQAFSIAGKRRGFEDTRGTMFFELARILRAKQPRLFVFENVKGLLSHDNGQTFRTIIQTLDELGYDLQWQVLNSKNHGVPQNRERVFIIGHLRISGRPQVFPIFGSEKESTRKTDKQGCASTLTGRSAGGQNRRGNYIAGTLRTHKDGNGFRKIKGDIAPTIPARAREDGSGQPVVSIDTEIRRLTPIECERLQGFPDGWTEGLSDTQRYKTLGNAVTVNVIHTIMSKLLT